MTRISRSIAAASGFWLASVAAALAQIAHRPFAVAGGEGGGGGNGGVAGWLMGEQSVLTHLMAAKVHALHTDSGAAWGLDRARPRLRRLSRRRPWPRQSGDRLLHAGQRALAQARSLAFAARVLAAGRRRDRPGRDGGHPVERHRLRDEPRRRLDRTRQLLRRRFDGPLARLAQGRRAGDGAAPPLRAGPRAILRPRFRRRRVERPDAGVAIDAVPRRGARRRRAGWRLRLPDLRWPPRRSTARFPGGTPPQR